MPVFFVIGVRDERQALLDAQQHHHVRRDDVGVGDDPRCGASGFP